MNEDIKNEDFNLCPHGRHNTAVCIPCAEEEYVDPFDMKPEHVEEKQNNGLDAEYYDLPENVRCVQDLIEWLKLDFSNGNILKSIVREHNPDDKKHTDALYEAEKRYFFASRHLQRVRNLSK